MNDRPDIQTQLSPGLIRILAPNPSPMTYWGTNSFLFGDGVERVLIDPGPDDAAHRAAILAALPSGVRISHILVTHAHLDQSEGAAELAEATDAPIYAFGNASAGRSAVMTRLAKDGLTSGGEGRDTAFAPDMLLTDGDTLTTEAGEIRALHTPGHMGNHLSFEWRDVIFCGDLVMGWSSSLISPPDGDAAAFRTSCETLLSLAPARLYPAHGAAIDAPAARITELLAHRSERERQILAVLADGPQSLTQITERVYHDLPPAYLPIAARNTLAHLIDLTTQNRVAAHPKISDKSMFSIT